MVRKRVALALSLIFLGLGIGIGVGYFVGFKRWFGWGMHHMEQQTTFVLDHDLQTLSYIRAGDLESAIDFKEANVDRAIVALRGDRSVSELPVFAREVLGRSKVYRALYPPDEKARVSNKGSGTYPSLRLVPLGRDSAG